MKIKVLVEFTVNTDTWDQLDFYLDETGKDGWERNEENAVWYFAEQIALDGYGYGVIGEVVDERVVTDD